MSSKKTTLINLQFIDKIFKTYGLTDDDIKKISDDSKMELLIRIKKCHDNYENDIINLIHDATNSSREYVATCDCGGQH